MIKKFAIICHTLDAINLAHRLLYEECEVYYYCKEPSTVGTGFKRLYQENGEVKSFINKHKKDCIFIAEGSDNGKMQDDMRKEGIPLIGSTAWGDHAESDRAFGYEEAERLKIPISDWRQFNKTSDLVKHIRQNPKPYIVKQSGNLPKSFNYAGKLKDGSDIIDHLETIEKKHPNLNGKLIIQDIVEGTEIAVGAWFDGKDWIKQDGKVILEINAENKKLLYDDKGIPTGEMGTGAKIILGECELFNKMLKPLEKDLKQQGYIGCVDANCCVTDKGKLFLYEHTCRLGYPIQDLYHELLDEDEHIFFNRLVGKEEPDYAFNTKVEGIVLTYGVPMFPYEQVNKNIDDYTDEVVNLTLFSEDDYEHFNLSCVKQDRGKLRVANSNGTIGTISYADKTFDKSNKKCLEIIDKIIPTTGFFRPDIGDKVTKRFNNKEVMEVIAT